MERYLLCSRAVMESELCHDFDRFWRVSQLHGKLGRAAELHELLPIALQLRIFGERRAHFAKNTSGVVVRWIDQAVMHPFSFTTRIHNLRAAQVCKVPRNLRLAGLENRYQKTDTHFRIANQTD